MLKNKKAACNYIPVVAFSHEFPTNHLKRRNVCANGLRLLVTHHGNVSILNIKKETVQDPFCKNITFV